VELQPADYIECFERAFEEPFAHIAFDTMDFSDVSPRLLRLAEYLHEYYAAVIYPLAETGEIIPFVTSQARGHDEPLFTWKHDSYNPPLWHDDLRRVLLFAHKVVFEDPLPEALGAVLEYLHPDVAETHLGGTTWASFLRPDNLTFLRRVLVNVQKLEVLIRRGIVIPHRLLNERLPGYGNSLIADELVTEECIGRAIHLSESLAALISSGYVDGFHLPANMVEFIKRNVSRNGGWKNVRWWEDIFEDIYYSLTERAQKEKLRPSPIPPRWPLETSDPLRYWADHIYKIAKHRRYIDEYKLGYSPHFIHSHGFQINEILEAADLATGRQFLDNVDTIAGRESKYADAMHCGRVHISRLDAFLRPRNDILKDADLVSIRLNEPLFAKWRDTVEKTLEAVRHCELETGRSDPNIVTLELAERYNAWRFDSAKELRGSFLRDTFETGTGTAISIVANVLLDNATFGLTMAIPAVRKLFGAGVRIFEWRDDQTVYSRHFLSIM
jgi:hypothetical protein